MNTLPVTIVLLVHRNDERLVACLSACTFAQEVIILDYNSGVNWQPWQQKLTLRCISKAEALRDFAAARQQGLDLATHEWVLSLDSDEVFLPSNLEQLSALIQDDRVDGYWIQRKDFFYGQALKHGEVGQTWILRLLRKRHSHFHRAVHEVATVSGVTARSSLLIHHFPHQSINEFFAKITLYAAMEAQLRTAYSFPRLLLEILCYPLGKFLANFVVRAGFRDGWRGLVYAVLMSLHSLFVRIFIYEKMANS